MKNVFVSSHPLVLDALTHLRDTSTSLAYYRFYATRITELLLQEAVANLTVKAKPITTPLTKTEGVVIDENIVIVTIFRAGLSMLQSAIILFPNSPVGFAGLARDEKTAIANEYYWKMPTISSATTLLLLDPMLATGGSLLHVLRKIEKPKTINIVSVLSAPEGITAVHKEFPEAHIFTAAIDERLNDQKFIVPGLGDFGDRYFGTDH